LVCRCSLVVLGRGEVSAKSIGIEARSSKKTILSHHERPANPLLCFDARSRDTRDLVNVPDDLPRHALERPGKRREAFSSEWGLVSEASPGSQEGIHGALLDER